jgi:hypothetical protein
MHQLDNLVIDAAAEIQTGGSAALERLEIEFKNNRRTVIDVLERMAEPARDYLTGYLGLPYDYFDSPEPDLVIAK